MPALDRLLRLLFSALAAAFAVTGLLFFCFPDATVATLNAAGRPLGFPPAPASPLRFWLSLAVAYMVLVTCAGYFVASSPAFIYLANALVDGTLALTALGAYGLVWATSETGAARDRELLKAVLDALVPRGGAFPIGAADTDLDETLARYFARLHPFGPAGLRVLLRAIEYGTVVFERTRPFSRLDPAARERALAAWETSRLGLRRQLVASVKLLGLLHFYERPETWPGIGYDDAHLRRKLLAGPNAAAHAARLGA